MSCFAEVKSSYKFCKDENTCMEGSASVASIIEMVIEEGKWKFDDLPQPLEFFNLNV